MSPDYELVASSPPVTDYLRLRAESGLSPKTEDMAVLLDRVREAAPPGAYVNLLADPPGVRLYERHGFEATAPGSVGMARRL
jgi:hypothetical protein